MAILDAFSLFSGSYSGGVITGQTVTGTNTSVVSTNSYDTQAALTLNTGGQSVDLGKGEEFDIEFDVLVAASGGTSIAFEVINADDAALTTNVTVIGSTGPVVTALLTAGKRISLAVPKSDPQTLRRYVGVRYTIVGAMVAGAYSAGFTTHASDLPNPFYKSGFVVA